MKTKVYLTLKPEPMPSRSFSVIATPGVPTNSVTARAKTIIVEIEVPDDYFDFETISLSLQPAPVADISDVKAEIREWITS